jgi:hypothetical protein
MATINWNDIDNNKFLPTLKPQGAFNTNIPTLTRKIKVRKGYTNLPKDLYSTSKKHRTFGIKVKG